jgi:Holliday junction resolvase RusA-like endonuclease
MVVHTKPRPKGRPRFSRGRTYTPDTTIQFEQLVRAAWIESGGPTFEGPVEMDVTFYPDRIEVVVRELDPEQKSALRGDIDNYVKSLLDGLNKAAFDDDRRVLRLTARKA